MKRYWHWGTGIAVVYSIFAATTVGFAVFAMGQRVELVSEDYYAKALDHDRHMAAVANGVALGGAFRIDQALDSRSLKLIWSVDARPEAGGSLTLYRPSDVRADRVVRLTPNLQGWQRVDLSSVAEGRWIAQVQWHSGGRDYYVERAVIAR